MPKLLIFLFPPGVQSALGFWFFPSSIKQVLFVSWSKCLWYIIHFVWFFHIIQKTSSICFCNIKNILGFLIQSSLCWISPHHSKNKFYLFSGHELNIRFPTPKFTLLYFPTSFKNKFHLGRRSLIHKYINKAADCHPCNDFLLSISKQ